MRDFMIRDRLPETWRGPLWGDRRRWGLDVRPADPDWQEWEHAYLAFYAANQRAGIGTSVNDAGYRVMRRVDLEGRRVLEIGPGDIRHIRFWRGRPREYVLVDIQTDMLDKARLRLEAAGMASRSLRVERGQALPLEDGSIDIAVSFYSLEHMYPLQPYVAEICRVLKPGGTLVGAIPAEGGLAWGLGRMLTSRRWFRKHTRIDPDKIICWEHPNFADEVVAELDRRLRRRAVRLWPLSWLPWLDVNLIVRFVYAKPG